MSHPVTSQPSIAPLGPSCDMLAAEMLNVIQEMEDSPFLIQNDRSELVAPPTTYSALHFGFLWNFLWKFLCSFFMNY